MQYWNTKLQTDKAAVDEVESELNRRIQYLEVSESTIVKKALADR